MTGNKKRRRELKIKWKTQSEGELERERRKEAEAASATTEAAVGRYRGGREEAFVIAFLRRHGKFYFFFLLSFIFLFSTERFLSSWHESPSFNWANVVLFGNKGTLGWFKCKQSRHKTRFG